MVPDIKTITIKQNVPFHGGVCPENFQPEQIKNDRFAAIIDFNMRNIWKTMPDS